MFANHKIGLVDGNEAEPNLQALRQHNIIPEIIEHANILTNLQVFWTEKTRASMGNTLKPKETMKPPSVTWDAEDGAHYTLIKTDPDAPSRKDPKYREFHHWIVGNIPGNDVSKGETISQYIGEGPPKDSGLHRFVYLLYKQPKGQIDFKDTPHLGFSTDGRAKFHAREFAKKYSLGDPIGVNFYFAEWDESVPKLYEQMSKSAK